MEINTLQSTHSLAWTAFEKSGQQAASLINAVTAELNIQKDFKIGYSRPIDPNMAYATFDQRIKWAQEDLHMGANSA